MSIINCNVQYIRPKYNNLEEWMKDASTLLLTETASSRMFLEVEKHIKGDLPKRIMT